MANLRKTPVAGPALLMEKLRTGGLPWLAARLREEWILPRTGPGQALHRSARALRRALAGQRPASAAVAGSGGLLYAFYDLAVAPVTFDFLWFLIGADLERRRRGLAAVHVVIVPGALGGLRRENPEYESRVTAAARLARIDSILVPASGLLASVSGVTVASTREQAEQLANAAPSSVFPGRYEPALPIYPGPQEPLRAAREHGDRVALLRASDIDLERVDSWLAAQGCTGRVIAITLRNYGYTPERNSNMAAWAELARRLDRRRYWPVFVPDAEQCLDDTPPELNEFPVFNEAALVLGLRMALYQRAHLNLGVNNGPMGLCWLNERTRYITFKILSNAAPNTSAEYMRLLGFEIGASLPFATPWQAWVWEDDDLAVIERAASAMLDRLDAATASGGPTEAATSQIRPVRAETPGSPDRPASC